MIHHMVNIDSFMFEFEPIHISLCICICSQLVFNMTKILNQWFNYLISIIKESFYYPNHPMNRCIFNHQIHLLCNKNHPPLYLLMNYKNIDYNNMNPDHNIMLLIDYLMPD